jgi:hypothetical protein
MIGGVKVIQEHLNLGNKLNSFHDFVFSQEGPNLHISSGTYWRNNQTQLESNEPMSIEISPQSSEMMYEVWVTSGGILLFSASTNAPINYNFQGFEPIDRLCWFIIPAGKTLDDAEINVIKIVEE